MTSNIDKIPTWKYVLFDLPYLILVKDGFKDKNLEDWAQAYLKEEKDLPYSPYAPRTNEPGYMIIGGGFPVYLAQDPLANSYVTKVKDIHVGIQFLKRINNNRITSTKLCGEIIGDRTGRASFSTVRINFRLDTIKPELYDDMQLFTTLATEAINRFLNHYRIITKRFYVKPVTKSVIQSYSIITEFNDGSTHSQEYGSGSGSMHGLGGSINEKQDERIRKKLVIASEPAILDTLKLDIDDKLDLQDWRLAIIESAVLFETWINKFLRYVYKRNGLLKEQIEDKFINPRTHLPKSIDDIVRNLILDATGYDFKTSSEYTRWKINTKDIRNKIVHGNIYRATQKQALVAKDCSYKAITKIKKETGIRYK